MNWLAFLKCLSGPRLIKVYSTSGRNGINYSPSGPEKFGDGVLKLVKWSFQLSIYTSPFLVWILYKKDYLCYDGLNSLLKLTTIYTLLYASSLVIRAFGRLRNPHYIKFINQLEDVRKNYNSDTKKELAKYDYEFTSWPVDFDVNKVDEDLKKPKVFINQNMKERSITDFAKVLPCRVLGYIVAHTIGIRLLYPGTIIQHFIETHLVDGRTRLVEELGGERCKLLTCDGNTIDCISVDRRKRTGDAISQILVICCEGNAGFYEVGMIGTPLEAGYSALGWNHPGFGGSSGSPFPLQEQYAVDAAVKFAINKLNFPEERIMLYGWSIGGFTASWAAMNYPNIKAVILDASFDHVLPLAANVMPSSWKSIVTTTVKYNLNLNVAEQLIKYPGPVVLFRRMRDEVIALEPGTLATNRGNNLLVQLLKFRYPYIVDSVTIPRLREWLNADSAEREELNRSLDISFTDCLRIFKEYIDEHSNSYPMLIGQNFSEEKRLQILIFLANSYLIDFDSTHCTPLPADVFRSLNDVGLETKSIKLRIP